MTRSDVTKTLIFSRPYVRSTASTAGHRSRRQKVRCRDECGIPPFRWCTRRRLVSWANDQREVRRMSQRSAASRYRHSKGSSRRSGYDAEIHRARRTPAWRRIRHHYGITARRGQIIGRKRNQELGRAHVCGGMCNAVISNIGVAYEAGSSNRQRLSERAGRLLGGRYRCNGRNRIIGNLLTASAPTPAAAAWQHQEQNNRERRQRSAPPPRRNSYQANSKQGQDRTGHPPDCAAFTRRLALQLSDWRCGDCQYG